MRTSRNRTCTDDRDAYWPTPGEHLVRAGRGMVLTALTLGLGATAVGLAFADAPNDNPFFPSGPVFLASAALVLAVPIGLVGLVLAACGRLARR